MLPDPDTGINIFINNMTVSVDVYEVEKDKSYSFKCETKAARPEPNITWTIGDKTYEGIQEDTKLSPDGLLDSVNTIEERISFEETTVLMLHVSVPGDGGEFSRVINLHLPGKYLGFLVPIIF